MSIHPRRFLASLLLLVSLLVITWSAWPAAFQSQDLVYSSGDLQTIINQRGIQLEAGALQPYHLKISWPAKMRVGDVQSILLVFAPVSSSPVPKQDPASSEIGPDQAEDASSSLSITIEARLEAPNLLLSPVGNISQKLVLGEPVSFGWRVQPAQAQKYQGTVWVYAQVTADGGGTDFRQVLSAQEISLVSEKFLGLDSLAARLGGKSGSCDWRSFGSGQNCPGFMGCGAKKMGTSGVNPGSKGACMLEVVTIVSGPVQTNIFLVADSLSRQAVVIDPAWDGQRIAKELQRRDWNLQAIWLTHAHFDHFAGAAGLLKTLAQEIPIALHPADIPLWRGKGGAPLFGMQIDPGPEPSLTLSHNQKLKIGAYEFQVRHTPGHTQGHVIYYCASAKMAFCGDVIFYDSIGRTDLPGGNYTSLLRSIGEQILSLPDDTRLLCGHGDETTVGRERLQNPFLS